MDETEYELLVDGEFVAGAFGPRVEAAREILHYAAMYAPDGDLSVEVITRKAVSLKRLQKIVEAA